MMFPPAVRFALVVLLLYVALPLYLGNALGGVPGLLSVAVGLLTALYCYGEIPRHAYPSIPGPPRKWLIGNLESIVKQGYHVFYDKVTKEYGRVACVQMGIWPQILIADPDIIKEVGLEKFDAFKDRKSVYRLRQNTSLFFSKGEKWHRIRKALNPSFNSIQLSAFADTINRQCQVLARRLDRVEKDQQDKPFDLCRLFVDFSMDVLFSTSFGIEFGIQDAGDQNTPETEKSQSEISQQQNDVLKGAKSMLMNLSGPLGSGGAHQKFVAILMPFLSSLHRLLHPYTMNPQAKRHWELVEKMEEIMKEIVDGRSLFSASNVPSDKEKQVTNFIKLLRKAREPDTGIGLTPTEVRDQVTAILLAGYETTSTALACTAFLLAQHPEVEARLVEEIQRLSPNSDQQLSFKDLAEFTYLNNVIHEALRLYPSVGVIAREATRDVDLADGKYMVKKGAWILINAYSLHRDNQYWDDPEKFDPDRFLPERSASRHRYTYLPFGIGPRNCLGQRFAVEEMKLALIAVYRNHTFQLHESTELPLKLRPGITLTPAEGIRVTVHRRKELGPKPKGV